MSENGKIIAVCNNKGGVGKTTLATNLSHAFSNLNKSVLVVDLDSQCNATSLLLKQGFAKTSLYDLFNDPGMPIESAIYATEYEQVKLLPNVEETSALELELLEMKGLQQSFKILRERLRDYAVNKFDYVILDTPPNMGFFVISALHASDFVIVPVLAGSAYSVEGLSRAIALITNIQGTSNPDLKFLRLLVNAVDMRTSMSRVSLRILAESFGEESIFKTTIPVSAAFQQAEHFKKSVIRHAPKTAGARAYRELALEIEDILNSKE